LPYVLPGDALSRLDYVGASRGGFGFVDARAKIQRHARWARCKWRFPRRSLLRKTARHSGAPGRWFPVAVTLSNSGEAVSGDVSLRLIGTDFEYAPTNITRLSICRPIPTRSCGFTGDGAQQHFGCGNHLFRRGFRSLVQRAQSPNPTNPEQRLAIVVSDSNDGLVDTLKSLRGQALFRGGAQPTLNPTRNRCGHFKPRATACPTAGLVSRNADFVVLGDFAHTSLAPPQIEALRGYVQGGGNLVVVGGGNAARLASSPLRDLWPQTPQTSASASTNEVAGLVERYVENPQNGADRLGGSPVQIVRGPNVQRALLRDGRSGAPLFSLLDSGAGRTLMLSTTPRNRRFAVGAGRARCGAMCLPTSFRRAVWIRSTAI
jgi:hypothetical protein